MESTEMEIETLREEKTLSPTISQITTPSENGTIRRATFLRGEPVVQDIDRWCRKHSGADAEGVRPTTLAVVYFDTGNDAEEYLRIKAEVAAKAGIGYASRKLSPEASLPEVLRTISRLNDDPGIHGILVQRPIRPHLPEQDVMSSIMPAKHVEEWTPPNKRSNIAADGVRRLLAKHHAAGMLKRCDIVLAGGLNIITEAFKDELRRRYSSVREVAPSLDEKELFNLVEVGDTTDNRGGDNGIILISELNKGGVIKPSMLSPRVKMVIDLGFDVNTKMGDLDPEVHEMEGLLVAPTPGGVLPILLWLMMERTIRSSIYLHGGGTGFLGSSLTSCLQMIPNCTVL